METGGSALGVGSYNRAAWMKKEGVTKSGDKYYKLIQLADSSTAWKEVEIPPDILAQERAAAGKVSEMIFNTMEAETQSLVRKVGPQPQRARNPFSTLARCIHISPEATSEIIIVP